MIAKDRKFLFTVIYFIVLSFTICLSYSFISSYIQQKQEFELFKQSWQYVADTNFETEIEIDPITNEEKVVNLISSPEQLAGFFMLSNNVSAESISSLDGKLNCNLDLSGKTWSVQNFSGDFDGGGFVISNLTISGSGNSNRLGFVAKLSSSSYGGIKNLFFNNISVTYTGSSTVYVGGVCGELASGNISNVHIKNSYSTIKSNSNASYVGGIVGVVSGISSKVENCSNEASIQNGGTAGGIVGQVSNGAVSNCYNYGTVSGNTTDSVERSYCYGGIVGNTSGTIQYCRNQGNVSCRDDAGVQSNTNSKVFVGGIVGFSFSSVLSCGNSGEIKGGNNVYIKESYVGGIAGQAWADMSNCYNKGNLTCHSKSNFSSDSVISATQKEQLQFHIIYGNVRYPVYLEVWLGRKATTFYNNKSPSIYFAQTEKQTTYNSYAGGIVGKSDYDVSGSYNKGTITSDTDEYTMKKMLTSMYNDNGYNASNGLPASRSDFFTYEITVSVPAHTSGINGNKASSLSNCYSTRIYKYKTTKKMMGYYLNWNGSGSDGTTDEYTKNKQDTLEFDTNTSIKTSSNIDVSYSSNQINCTAYIQNSGVYLGAYNKSATISGSKVYAINKSISFYQDSCDVKTYPSSSDLGSAWTSNTSINGGDPYPSGLYW